ncbi:hypothetical protein Rt10032_c21g6451 [Rhodotorula toruloides]|uniref:NYN domain-containing protein n=1 Tax=Rhodotorula toruloides TaxID=5286 RepID=A0A511KSE2_RHOTO|nr:hypothetical protein Rt10032_c21g6451 [Rhodotorula toruloides]
MPNDTAVQIFWDYENIRFPSKYDAAPALKRLRDLAHSYGVLARAAVYVETGLERGNRKTELRQVLQSTGWHVIDAPHAGKKDVVDKMIMVDMCSFGFTQKSPVILLITADRDYAYACSTLRNHRCRIILITTVSAAPVLRHCFGRSRTYSQAADQSDGCGASNAAVAGPSATTAGSKKDKGMKKAKTRRPDVMTLSSSSSSSSSSSEEETEYESDGSPSPKSKKARSSILDLTLSSINSQRVVNQAAAATAPQKFPRSPPPPNTVLDEKAHPNARKKRRRSSVGDDDDIVIVQ